MINYPFVSIIIPAKNEENIIEACFIALMKIEYPKDKYEIILVDNGSTDNTVNIAMKFNIRYYIKPGLTISALRNHGAFNAKGNIFAFVDADVIVSVDWLLNAVKNLDDNAVACTGSSPSVPADSTWVEKTWNLQVLAKIGTRPTNWIASMNFIIRKDAFLSVGGFNELLKTCEDVDMCYRLGNKTKILYDSNIKSVHLGEAKTLVELFKKESWRGIGNLSGIASHGLNINEVPSHCVALYYFMFTILFPVFIIKNMYYCVIVVIIIALIFPIIKSVIISNKLRTYRHILQLLVVWLVYGFGRGWSLWRIITFRFERR